MNVQDCMTKDADVIGPQTTLKEAASRMRAGDFGAIPVGANDHLLGMITDRDIAIEGVALGKDPETTAVGDIMSDDIIYCYEDDSIEDAANAMAKHQVRRLPVLNRHDRFVGIISLGDISKAEGAHAAQALSSISEPTHHEPSH